MYNMFHEEKVRNFYNIQYENQEKDESDEDFRILKAAKEIFRRYIR